MKKILFVALAATFLAAGCQKTEIINRVGDSIGFSTELGKITKALGDAEDEGIDNLQKQGILVSAFYVADDPNKAGAVAGSVYDGMDKSPLIYKDATWTPDKEYYWPGKGKYLNFFAVSGLVAFNNETEDYELNPDAVTISSTEIKVTDFTVDPKNANVDLMVADLVQQSQDEKTKVALKFNHVLSKVEFIFKTTKDTKETIFVQKLVVKDLHNKNTFTATAPEAVAKGTNAMTLSWDKLEVAAEGTDFEDDYDVDFADTESAKFPTSYTEFDADHKITDKKAMWLNPVATDSDIKPFTTWLMIPQPITGKEVEVTYLIDNRQFVAVFPLDVTNTLDAWEPNQYVKYTVTLAPNKIEFAPEVKPWDPTVDVDPEMGEVITPENSGDDNGNGEEA